MENDTINIIMLCLAAPSGLIVSLCWLFAVYESVKMRAWEQIAGGIALGFVSAVALGWLYPLAFLLLPLGWIGTIHIIAERIKEWS
ncbi:MAG: hypothetical protein LUJ25_06075 [Firmicutes bacterium]|nr:hypothetical protein [Bacillota bacterium]